MTQASLAQLDVDIRNVVMGVPQLRRAFEHRVQVTDYVMQRTKAPEELRYWHVDITDGSRIVYVEADQEITIYHGTSVEGHRIRFLVEVGNFDEGLSIDAQAGTEILVIAIKEVK